MQKTVYQYDLTGRYLGATTADESPREPGIWLLPARTTEQAPPEQWPEEKWPRWNGSAWELTGAARANNTAPDDPVAKLQGFLQANPDVAELLR
jgi:hypothetical protein